ncbi:MAG: hypothetical protein JOY69_03600 [Candidatus Eremiobacteraeota bacterium]|nr:hypothetical protein [Candidatus Eremiobacteraeota bacterium]
MEKEPRNRDIEERIGDVREGVTGADATGLIAGEELITQAETLLPLQRPSLPQDDLHAALPSEHEAHATIDRLQAEIEGSNPDRGAIEEHVTRLRALPELEAIVGNWWESPSTQRFVWNLSQIGL